MRTLPLISYPSFEFTCVLEEYTFRFKFQWYPNQLMWTVDMSCEELDMSIAGFRVVTGMDLFHGRGLYQVGRLIFLDMQGQTDPDYEGFGDRYKLIHQSRAEVASAAGA